MWSLPETPCEKWKTFRLFASQQFVAREFARLLRCMNSSTSLCIRFVRFSSMNFHPVSLLLFFISLNPVSPVFAHPLAKHGRMRVLLEHAGLDQTAWDSIHDGREIQGIEFEVLAKILHRLPRIGTDRLVEWSHSGENVWKAVDSPAEHRADTFFLQGRASHVDLVELPREVAQRWHLGQVYRVRLDLQNSTGKVIVYTLNIPKSWQPHVGKMMDERVSGHGLFFKLDGAEVTKRPLPVLLAPRIAWMPDRIDKALATTSSLLILGNLGMDVGLFDQIQDRQALTKDDRECFYQLLAATAGTAPTTADSRLPHNTRLAKLLGSQVQRAGRGELVSISGNVRRAVRIAIEAADIRNRFGIDHYYELNVFVNESVRVKRSSDDPEPTYYSTYPVVCCVAQLPAGMPEGDDVNEAIRVSGFYYKIYSYETDFTTAKGPNRRQFSPLIVGFEPKWIQRRNSFHPAYRIACGVVAVCFLLSLWILIGRLNRGDAVFRRTVVAKHLQPPADASLENLKIDSDPPSPEIPSQKSPPR